MDDALEPLEYHRLQRALPWSWWRPVLGVAVLALLFVVVVPVATLLAFTVGLGLLGSGDVAASVERMLDTDHVTPLALAYLNVSIALMIPATWLVAWVLHRQRPGWLSSVAPRIRWRWLAVCLGLALVALMLTLVAATFVPASADAGEVSTGLNAWTTTTRDFVLVVLLLTPLQAAAEEYVFRGYLTQAFGGWVRSRWLAVVGPALLFALAHGAQDPQIFIDRFAFGLVAGILVILTGGLEAGIAMHVLNNFFAFGLALAFGDITGVLNPTGGSWWSLVTTLTQSVSFLVLSVAVARRMGVRTVAQGPVLAGPKTRV